MKKFLTLFTLLTVSTLTMANNHYSYVGIDLNNEGIYIGYTPWQYLSVELGVAKVYTKSKVVVEDTITDEPTTTTTTTEDTTTEDTTGSGVYIDGQSYLNTISIDKTNNTTNIYNYIGSSNTASKGSYSHTPRASLLLHTSMSNRLFLFGKYSYDKYDNYTTLGFGANLTRHISSRVDYNLDDKSIGVNIMWRF